MPSTEELLPKLVRLICCETAPDGERLAAVNRLSAIAAAHDIDWDRAFANGNAPALSEEQMSRIYTEGYNRGHSDGVQQARPARDWTPSGGSAEVGGDAGRLKVILTAAAQFRDNRPLAWKATITGWESDFLYDIGRRFTTYGNRMYVSERQWAVLDRLETKMQRAGVL